MSSYEALKLIFKDFRAQCTAYRFSEFMECINWKDLVDDCQKYSAMILCSRCPVFSDYCNRSNVDPIKDLLVEIHGNLVNCTPDVLLDVLRDLKLITCMTPSILEEELKYINNTIKNRRR